MKKKIILFILSLYVVSSSYSQISKATLQASGLTCAMCARSIFKNLESLPFVDKVDTDLNASSFLITFKPNSPLDIEALSKKVQDAGFSVASLTLSVSLNSVKVQQDSHVIIGDKFFHFVNVKPQVLNGNVGIRLIDPAFVSNKESKKFLSMTKMSCMKTGKSESCCIAAGVKSDVRVFHVTT